MTLAELNSGQDAVIQAVSADEPAVIRLMTLGLVQGAPVRCVGAAIGGDPIEFQVLGASLSVRKEQAKNFTVTDVTSKSRSPAL